MKRYHIVRDSKTDSITYLESKDPTLDLNFKNKNIAENAISVDKMIIINPSLNKKLILRRLNIKFKNLFKLVQEALDVAEDDEDDELLDLALDQATKLRQELLNKYLKFFNNELDAFIKNLEEIELTLLKKKLTFERNKTLENIKKAAKSSKRR